MYGKFAVGAWFTAGLPEKMIVAMQMNQQHLHTLL
jgi:hypothetical protein